MAYSVSDILNTMLGAIEDILGNVASVIAANAGVIAEVVVIGGLVYGLVRFGNRLLRPVFNWVTGLF